MSQLKSKTYKNDEGWNISAKTHYHHRINCSSSYQMKHENYENLCTPTTIKKLQSCTFFLILRRLNAQNYEEKVEKGSYNWADIFYWDHTFLAVDHMWGPLQSSQMIDTDLSRLHWSKNLNHQLEQKMFEKQEDDDDDALRPKQFFFWKKNLDRGKSSV